MHFGTESLSNHPPGLLTEFRDPKLVARTLDYIFSDKTRTQDLPRMLGAMMFNPASRDATWAGIKARHSRSLSPFDPSSQFRERRGRVCAFGL